ncbi:MAG TPA: undecaprenyl-diphosphate phosphatase [Thermoanaerobaculia bacterium]|nr:undecaprenyl-diphosphate phosphatase [Thermoanaerobaculia bacterium]
MSYLQAMVLALVQGVTEFLPISSSAHLVLVPYLFGWPDQGLGFDVAVNTGTLLAVVVYLRRELAAVTRAGLASLAPRRRSAGEARPGRLADPSARLAWGVALATVPVAVAGLLAYDWVATAGRSPVLIAGTSIGFGLLLGWADRAGARRRELGSVTLGDAAFVGLAQALALIPGTSRSGVTITAGLARGLTREEAARFSFLLYVPVGVLAAAKEVWDFLSEGGPVGAVGPSLVGFAVAAVSAYLAIGALLAWVRRQSLTVFVIYRIALGLVILGVVFL